jgi:hypothetical protein
MARPEGSLWLANERFRRWWNFEQAVKLLQEVARKAGAPTEFTDAIRRMPNDLIVAALQSLSTSDDPAAALRTVLQSRGSIAIK